MIRQVGKPETETPTPPSGWKAIGRLLLATLVLWIIMGPKDFILWKDGRPELTPWGKAKLERELEELDSAEQYVLFARIPESLPPRHQ